MRTSRLTLLLILVVCPEVFAFTVLMPWTFLGVSSSVHGQFFSRLSPRMDLQSLGEGLSSLARERLFSSAAVDEHSHWFTHRLSDFGVLIMWVWNSASDFILGWFNRHFWFLMSSVTSPWVVRSSVFAQWSALDPVCYQVAFSFTNWFFVDLLLLLLCPFMCYRNFGWEDTCNFNITEFIFWYVLLVLISTCIVS